MSSASENAEFSFTGDESLIGFEPFSIELPLSITPAQLRKDLPQLNDPQVQLPEQLLFLLHGEFLDPSKPIFDVIQKMDLSTETSLNIEIVVPSFEPPRETKSFPHDDAVMAVCQIYDKWIITGCLDGTFRIWNRAGDQLLQHRAHEYPITALEAVPSDSKKDTEFSLICGSKDSTVSVWAVKLITHIKEEPIETPSKKKKRSVPSNVEESSVTEIVTLTAHSQSVSALSVDKMNTVCATGGWDGCLFIYPLQHLLNHSNSTNPEKKRSKREGQADDSEEDNDHSTVPTPAVSLRGHRGAITGVLFEPGGHFVWTGGMDHRLIKWSISEKKPVLEMHAPNSILSLTGHFTSTSSFLTTSHVDGSCRLWTPMNAQKRTHRPYKHCLVGYATSVMWMPDSETHFLCVGHDGRVSVWDYRSHIPLHRRKVQPKKDEEEESGEYVMSANSKQLKMPEDAWTMDNYLYEREEEQSPTKILCGCTMRYRQERGRESVLLCCGCDDGTLRTFVMNTSLLKSE
ncbi:putative Ribosome biogenesis protein WDR12 like protein [Blattamonas nauphoetae]|uniref:Ribosome biogenesis protein WDR12 like protein n=1 Tax=Blattamonas nauphoetae TaxID=2049346 RepID=A0ABQ9XX92_9EUKA|nr:putative Ribosome biogenesis protein WDR12 like protein [Blattamonas nauphoetae]